MTRRLQQASIKNQILWAALAVLLPMLAALGVLAYRIEQLRAAALVVSATHEAIYEGNRLLKLFSEMQLSVRAYVLAGDEMFFEAYQRARVSWPDAVERAAQPLRGDPAQSERLAEVRRDVGEFLSIWDERLPAVRPGGDDQTAWMRIGEDEGRMRRISATISELVAQEEQVIRGRLAHEELARQRVYMGAVITCVAALALLATFATFLSRSIARPIARVAEAADRLGAGQWDERVPAHGGREARVLATAFNNMAAALQEARSSLAARNRELEQSAARLATANEDLRERQRETDDFLYVLSHDLRAPLINIQGFGKRLQANMTALEGSLRGSAPAGEPETLLRRMAESLRFVNAATAKIDQLISRLLEIARLTTRPTQHQWIDTDAMVRDVIGACQFQLGERGITVSVGGLPRVFGDPVQLNQVFTNLVDNAIKYMGDRPRKQIIISCTGEGERYRFAVQDTGPGIAPKDQEKVFRLFSRLAPSAGPGEGIGLTAVRAIVNRHGGRIWVESTPDVGSTFYFSVPRNTGEIPVVAEDAGRAEQLLAAARRETHAHAN